VKFGWVAVGVLGRTVVDMDVLTTHSAPADVLAVVDRLLFDGVIGEDDLTATYWVDSGGSLHSSQTCNGVTGERLQVDLRAAVGAFSASWCECNGVLGSPAGSACCIGSAAYNAIDLAAGATHVESWEQAAVWLDAARPDSPLWPPAGSGNLGRVDVLVVQAIDAASDLVRRSAALLPFDDLRTVVAAPGMQVSMSAAMAREVANWLGARQFRLQPRPYLSAPGPRRGGTGDTVFDRMLDSALRLAEFRPRSLLVSVSRHGWPSPLSLPPEVALVLVAAGRQIEGRVWFAVIDAAVADGIEALFEMRHYAGSALLELPQDVFDLSQGDGAGDVRLLERCAVAAQLWQPDGDGPLADLAVAFEAATRV